MSALIVPGYRQYFSFVFTLVTVFSAVYSSSAQSNRPNIVLIMADDMGYECLSANGSLEYETPVLDKLGDEGIRFTHCISQPLCTPSRVKLMTGQYNFRNYSHFGYLNPKQLTFGQVMKSAGYKTCIVGKWQLNGLAYPELPGLNDTDRPHKFGFDEYSLWQLTRPRKDGERFANPLIEQNGEIMPRDPNLYGPDHFCQYALDFIERNKEEPFFIYYPMVLVHDPFVPTPDSDVWSNPERRYENDTSYFKDMVAYTDKIVGRLVDKLKKEKLFDNTIFIFTADNGNHPSLITRTSNGQIRGAKGNTIGAGTHVPLVVSWPQQIKSGYTYEGLIEFSDFFPTLAEVAGKEVSSDGLSFLPLLKGAQHKERKSVFVHYDPRWGKNVNRYRNQFAQTVEYKLYQDGKLFDLINDPLEQHPLSPDDGRTRQVRRNLESKLNAAPQWQD